MNDIRRNPRKPVDDHLAVQNTITSQPMGRIGNLSIDGLMLIQSRRPRDDALYQVSFPLPDAQGRSQPIEIGIHETWTEDASVPGQIWSGFEIIDIAEPDRERLRRYIERTEKR
ncbi:MAG: PilZ domain-containing protein [Lysobacterales bacterium]